MLSALALAALAAVAQDGRNCEFTADRTATVAASSSDVLELVARAGSLVVEGRPGLSEVRVRGRACASSRELLDQLVIETSRAGGRVRVEVPEIEHERSFFGGNWNAGLDLVLEVPEGMEATITDGSGDAEIRGVGRLRMTDGSGGLRLVDIRGDVRIDDGSGEIEIQGVAGSVEVHDGSGEVVVRDVTGSVDVDDGSGSIDVSDVRGNFTVRDDGSGDIRYDNVRGRVDVPEKDRDRRRRRR
jgi:hypothetical protein